MIKKESILCAAIWYKEIPLQKEIPGVLPLNCDKGLVVLGYRHHECMWIMRSLTGLSSFKNSLEYVGNFQEGFLTNGNKFVSSEEAAQIAFDCGQIKQHTITLYPEDLY